METLKELTKGRIIKGKMCDNSGLQNFIYLDGLSTASKPLLQFMHTAAELQVYIICAKMHVGFETHAKLF